MADYRRKNLKNRVLAKQFLDDYETIDWVNRILFYNKELLVHYYESNIYLIAAKVPVGHWFVLEHGNVIAYSDDLFKEEFEEYDRDRTNIRLELLRDIFDNFELDQETANRIAAEIDG